MALIKEQAFLLDFLADYAPEFKKLKNPVMRATVGRLATMEMAAAMASVPVEKLLADVGAEIEKHGVDAEVDASRSGDPDAERVAALKAIIEDLHDGAPMDELKARFAELLQDVDATEIATMEQQLIAEGMPETEVKRMCDVHVEVLKGALEEHDAVDAPAGHPIHTFQAENEALEVVAKDMRLLLDGLGDAGLESSRDAVAAALGKLGAVELHYQRKENQLFPFLERKGVTAPPQVMWAIHDDVRAMLKDTHVALKENDASTLREKGTGLVETILDMAYKEEKVLFPMTFELLSEGEWAEIRRGEADIGYALVTPAAEWPTDETPTNEACDEPSKGLPGLALDTGLLTLDQINLLLKHLPVDVTFVDENDEVRYFTDSPHRIFPRSPGIIGRKVQLCHPAKSVHVVEQIVTAFRTGEKDVAEFWLELGGRFVHIRYFAVRDAGGEYKGTVEVSQDVTDIRTLEGQRRLLDWGTDDAR